MDSKQGSRRVRWHSYLEQHSVLAFKSSHPLDRRHDKHNQGDANDAECEGGRGQLDEL